MNAIHNTVGTLVVLAFLISIAGNLMTAFGGRSFRWQLPLAYGAATLLLLQYMLGFSLLGSGEDVPVSHYLVALLAILPVGFEHGFANTRQNLRQRGLYAAVAEGVTLALVLVAYIIGQSNA
jgi:hypothetical protein